MESGCPDLIRMTSLFNFIPVCPEQSGGLPTPRLPSRIMGGYGKDVLSGKSKILNSADEDVTSAFIRGAEESLRIAHMTGAEIALLKDKSPSCGISVQDRSKNNKTIHGVTAALLHSHGIRIIELNSGSEFPTPDFKTLLEEVHGIRDVA